MSDQNYGHAPPPPPPPPPQDNPGKGMSIAGMVLGIVGLVFALFLPYVGIVVAIVGLILSILGMKKSKEAGFPSGMAMAGLICSCIAIGLNIICLIIVICAVAALGGLAAELGGLF